MTWRRLVSLDRPHLAAIQMTLRPVNWSGRISVCSALDGRVVNWGVKRYRELEHRHLIPLETGAHGDLLHLVVQTNQSRIAVGQAARTRVFCSGDGQDVERRSVEEDGYVADHLTFEVEQGRAVAVEKIVALYISKDRASIEPGLDAREAVGIAPDFEALALAHQGAWSRLWRRCDLVYTADENVQQILRLHAFHSLQVTSPHTVDLDTSAPARGLHGEAYRGHIFWDELYIFPYFLHRAPEIVRGLLLYRYRRLDAARALAQAEGYRGAMFPWQSGASGREETQTMHLNPKSGRWNPDTSHHQRHVSLAVAFNTWEYVRVTDDRDFLAAYGAELLVEIARFWASISHFDETRGRYEIHGVMGPDEYHEKYPDSDEPGLRNNAYTNIMVAWLMDAVAEALERLDADRRADLLEKLGVANEELALWSDMSGKLFVPFHGEGIISQFEGYEALKELDWDAYREKYDNIQRMDRILEAEGGSADEYQLSKQADVLMLFYLFPSGELKHLFGEAGLPLRFGHHPAERRVLRGAHVARFHAVEPGARRRDGQLRARRSLAEIPRRARERRRGHPRRYDERRHPPRRHGGDGRPPPARLPRPRRHRRHADLRPRAAGTPRGPRLYPVFPRSAARRGGRGRAVDARRASRRLEFAGDSRRDGDRHAGAGRDADVQPLLIAGTSSDPD